MAFANRFRWHGPNTITCWEYTFKLTKDHMTEEDCAHMKQSYDVVGEKAYLQLKELAAKLKSHDNTDKTSSTEIQSKEEVASKPADPPTSSNSENGQVVADSSMADTKTPKSTPNPQDLWTILETHHADTPELTRLWDEVNTVPDWVDWEQLERGQRVFYRYGGACLTGLAYQSLLGGLGGFRVVETLARTGGFSVKVARRRLWETTQFILQVTQSIDAIKPGGEGQAASIRVRLLHAAVRERIMKMTTQRPSYYNVEEWGVPINDFDTLATALTFSATLIWLSLPRQGIWLRDQEATDFIALWRYVGYLMGTPVDHLATPGRAKATMEYLLMKEIQPSKTSRILANNMVRALQDSPPAHHSADMLVTMARWLNGNELGDALGLPRPSLYYWILMSGQCFFFMFMAYSNRLFPSSDDRKVKGMRKLLWRIVVDAKYSLDGKPTTFDFKYVPEYSIMTELGEAYGTPIRAGGLEKRNLIMFGVAATMVTGSIWTIFKIAKVGLGFVLG